MHHFDLNFSIFPQTHPDYERIQDDPVFDSAKHLALEAPTHTYTLSDLGYGNEVNGTTPTEIAATSCFRVLSDEGVAAMYHVCKQLEAFTTSNPRIARNTRGGTYRSNFLRDFSLDPSVTEHLSAIMQTALIPQPMPHQSAHLNYQPLTPGENVDKWHYDTLQVDTVMFVTDPNTMEGGEFQYFQGTREEMTAIHAAGQKLPAERVIAPAMPGAGYAVLMQGNYVVHQAKAVQGDDERITLVNGYSYADLDIPDYTAVGQLNHADPSNTVAAEYARHMSLRCARQLQSVINTPDFQRTPQQQAAYLRRTRDELEAAIHILETSENESMRHFGN